MSTSSDRSKPKRSERICFRGDPITSIEEVVAAWLRGEWFVICLSGDITERTDKSMHPEMILGMPMRTVLELISSGKLYRGVTKDGEPFATPYRVNRRRTPMRAVTRAFFRRASDAAIVREVTG